MPTTWVGAIKPCLISLIDLIISNPGSEAPYQHVIHLIFDKPTVLISICNPCHLTFSYLSVIQKNCSNGSSYTHDSLPITTLDIAQSDSQKRLRLMSPAAVMSGLPRVLLLSPPSLSSNPDKLAELINQYDKNARDLQMLDRLAAGLVSLPESTYSLVLLLTGIDGTNVEGERLVGRDTLQQISRALQSGGVMKYQDGSPTAINESTRTEAILCGLTVNDKGELLKPAFEEQSVSLPFSFNKSRKPKKDANSNKNGQQPAVLQNNIVILDNNTNDVFNTPYGDDDEELIDEDELIDADELERPIIQRKA